MAARAVVGSLVDAGENAMDAVGIAVPVRAVLLGGWMKRVVTSRRLYPLPDRRSHVARSQYSSLSEFVFLFYFGFAFGESNTSTSYYL